MVKFLVVLVLFVVTGVILFVNLGRFIDVTKVPQKADIIVSLGGDSGCRLQQALALYQAGYATSQKLLYTGDDRISKRLDTSLSKTQYLRHHGMTREHRVHVDATLVSNTMEEVYFVQQYMITHRYRKVIFVSHPQHSRRIATLASIVADYHADGLSFTVVSCEPRWWNRTCYFKNDTAIKAALRELAKLVYNVLKYGTPLRDYTSYVQADKVELWEQAIEKLP